MREISVNGQIGQIQIADEVLAIISGTAAHEVEGVMPGRGTRDNRRGKRNFSRRIKVKVSVNHGRVVIDVSIIVKFGYKIHVIAEEVQKRVKNALETMVGTKVSEVNVTVAGIEFERAAKSNLRPKQKPMLGTHKRK